MKTGNRGCFSSTPRTPARRLRMDKLYLGTTTPTCLSCSGCAWMEARLKQDSCREKLRRKSLEPRKLDRKLPFSQAYDSCVVAYELATGPENVRDDVARCGIPGSDICAKAAHKGDKRPTVECDKAKPQVTYSGHSARNPWGRDQ